MWVACSCGQPAAEVVGVRGSSLALQLVGAVGWDIVSHFLGDFQQPAGVVTCGDRLAGSPNRASAQVAGPGDGGIWSAPGRVTGGPPAERTAFLAFSGCRWRHWGGPQLILSSVLPPRRSRSFPASSAAVFLLGTFSIIASVLNSVGELNE